MVLPAIAVLPKLLTDACTKMFAKQNTAPCTADGIPVFRILPVKCSENFKFRSFKQNCSSFFMRIRTSNAERTLEISVAKATPDTPI